jgi:hypothetical protein
MKIKKLLPFILAFIIAGCVPVWSLHPLYDDQHQVFDEKLLGTFIEDTNDCEFIWEFKRADEANSYQLIFTGISKKDPNVSKGWFEVHLVKLDNQFFIDIFPKESPWGNTPEEDMSKIKWYWNAFFMMPVHTFAKIQIFDSELKIQLSDDDNLKKILKTDPNAVKYELIDKTPVLTASSKELQSFVLKYADDNSLFSDEKTLTRKISKPVKDANEPNIITSNANGICRDSNNLLVK